MLSDALALQIHSGDSSTKLQVRLQPVKLALYHVTIILFLGCELPAAAQRYVTEFYGRDGP